MKGWDKQMKAEVCQPVLDLLHLNYKYSSYITAGSQHCHLPSAESSIVKRQIVTSVAGGMPLTSTPTVIEDMLSLTVYDGCWNTTRYGTARRKQQIEYNHSSLFNNNSIFYLMCP